MILQHGKLFAAPRVVLNGGEVNLAALAASQDFVRPFPRLSSPTSEPIGIQNEGSLISINFEVKIKYASCQNRTLRMEGVIAAQQCGDQGGGMTALD